MLKSLLYLIFYTLKEAGMSESQNESPVFSIKPVYYFHIVFLRSIFPMIFLTAFVTAFLAIIGVFIGTGLPNMLGTGGGDEQSPVMISAGLGLVGGIISIFVYFFAIKNIYGRSKFSFFSDRVEYYEGFFTIMKKSIEYSKILEVTMTSGVLQQPKKLGTILLLTAATTVDKPSGLKIADIEDPDEYYTKIRQIVQKGRDS